MKIGSQAHKELFCRAFFDGHRTYEPADLPWPELAEEELALLRGLPFWTHARQFEADAGPMITAVAELEPDPLLREARQLQAFEEARHARPVDHMIHRYELPAEEAHVQVPADVLAEFIDFGFEECLDSFGAFGLFKLARDSRLVAEPIFEIFDQVMQEEAHHIVFFINWYAHHEAQRGAGARLLRPARSVWHYAKALRKIGDLLGDDAAEEGADFIVKGAEAFVDDLSPKLVIEACLGENERRLAGFDRRLLIPELVPRLAGIALAGLNLVPGRQTAPTPTGGTSKPEGSEPASRAA
jgi:hypothetical protein